MQFIKLMSCMGYATHFNDLACFITTIIITDQITLPVFQELFSMLARMAILKVIDYCLD